MRISCYYGRSVIIFVKTACFKTVCDCHYSLGIGCIVAGDTANGTGIVGAFNLTVISAIVILSHIV